MKSVVDFASEVNAILHGSYTFFPRFKLLRMRAGEWKEEKLEKRVADDEREIIEAEKKGSVKNISDSTRDLVKTLAKELNIEHKEITGEEAIEMSIIFKLGECLDALKDHKELRAKLKGTIDQLKKFTEEQLNDLAQAEEGGEVWKAKLEKMADIGQTSNDAINAIKNMRSGLSVVGGLLNDVKKKAGRISTDPQRKKDTAAYTWMEINIEKLEKMFRINLIPQLKDHFFNMLRLYIFLRTEIMHEIKHVDIMEKEGLSIAKAKSIEKKLNGLLKKLRKQVEKEKNNANRLVQQITREESET